MEKIIYANTKAFKIYTHFYLPEGLWSKGNLLDLLYDSLRKHTLI